MMVLHMLAAARGGNVECAFDVLESALRKNTVTDADLTAATKFQFVRLPTKLQRGIIGTFSDVLATTEIIDRAYFHLEKKHKSGRSLSSHSLDIIIAACAKIGDSDRALETVEAYPTLGLTPRAQTYNFLLAACSGRNNAKKHKLVCQAMAENGVLPTRETYKIRIAHEIGCDDVSEALSLIDVACKGGEKGVSSAEDKGNAGGAGKHHQRDQDSGGLGSGSNIRLHSEMISPVLNRAGKVGDLITCVHLVQLALNFNVALEPEHLRGIADKLQRVYGVNTEKLQDLIPLHEKLQLQVKRRSR